MDHKAWEYFEGLSPAHKLLAKHLLVLGLEVHSVEGVISRPVYTGFVAEVDGEWFWITAGHIIEELLIALSHGSQIVWKHFYDIGPRSSKAVDCPYGIEDIPYANAENGADYALIHLRPLTVDALRLNGVEPISRLSTPPVEETFERYNFVGCLKAYQESGDGFVAFAPAVLIMDRLTDDRREDGFVRYHFDVRPSRDNWPFGSLDSIVGMSGGPVFGYRFHDDGETFEYCCIAVQSSWDPKTWESYACPLRPLLEVIRTALERTRQD